MKTFQLNTLTNRIFIGAIALLIFFSFEASAKKVQFLTSAIVPAARGYVKINRDNNQNYVIIINISNLAEVYRLEPAKLTYVVWLETGDGIIMNMGKMKSTAGFFSEKLKASFITTTSLKPIKIFITAEDDPSLQYPGKEVVLTTSTF